MPYLDKMPKLIRDLMEKREREGSNTGRQPNTGGEPNTGDDYYVCGAAYCDEPLCRTHSPRYEEER